LVGDALVEGGNEYGDELGTKYVCSPAIIVFLFCFIAIFDLDKMLKSLSLYPLKESVVIP